MRSFFIVALIFTNLAITAQSVKLNLDYIDLNYGQFAGDMFSNAFNFVDTSSNQRWVIPSSPRIVYTGRYEFIARRRVAKNRFLTFGLLVKKYRYLATLCFLPTCRPIETKFTFNYTTLQIGHQFRFASNSFVELFFENSLQIDYVEARNSNLNLRPLSFSIATRMNCYFPINETNKIVFSPAFIIPVSRYNERKISTGFFPFSYGATIGYSRNVARKKQ